MYIQLQNVYKAKARKDCAEVFATVQENAEASIDLSEVEAFCKNAAFLKLVHGLGDGSVDLKDLASMCTQDQ